MNLGKVKEIGTFIKCLIWGASDSRTAEQSLPHGIVSKPVIGRVAVYSKTENNGRAVILGYVDATDDIQSGELKLYATNSEGVEQSNVLFTNDGYCEFMGNDDWFVRYSELKKEYDKTKDVVDIISQTLQTWVTVPQDGGAALKAAYVLAIGVKTTGDISSSKISRIKTYKSEGN